jgi:hypothetical protein
MSRGGGGGLLDRRRQLRTDRKKKADLAQEAIDNPALSKARKTLATRTRLASGNTGGKGNSVARQRKLARTFNDANPVSLEEATIRRAVPNVDKGGKGGSGVMARRRQQGAVVKEDLRVATAKKAVVKRDAAQAVAKAKPKPKAFAGEHFDKRSKRSSTRLSRENKERAKLGKSKLRI